MKPKEIKYTWKMIWCAIFVAILGLLEIAAGLVIQLSFAVMLSHFGNKLISEGISDLEFAASSWWIGYFDWNDYGRYKLQSMLQFLVLACISDGFGKGFKYSQFGEKLALSGIMGEGRKEVAKITGGTLAEEVSGKAIAKEFGKQFVLKVGEGLARGLINEWVNSLVDSYLQNLCNQLANSLVADIETTVNSHRIGQTLHDCYTVLGPKSSKELIVHYSGKSLSQTSMNNGIIATTMALTGAITVIFQYAFNLVDIVTSVSRMLDKVDKELRKNIQDACDRGVEEHTYNAEEAKDFKNDVLSQWRKMLRGNVNSIFTDKIAKPVLKNCALELAEGVIDGIKNYITLPETNTIKMSLVRPKQKESST